MADRQVLVAFLLMLIAVTLSGCGGHAPEEIHYGSDQCDYCKMTIADKSFGSELITSKGKVFKYDSIECLAAADIAFASKSQDVHSRWVTDFTQPGQFLDANKAWIIAAERQKSPMGVGLVAVSTEQSAEQLVNEVGGRIVTWSEAKEIVAKAWKLEIGN